MQRAAWPDLRREQRSARGRASFGHGLAAPLERFRAKWKPVRVKKTRQIKNLEPRFDSIETEKALAVDRSRCAGDELRHGFRLRKHRHVAALEDQSLRTHAIRRVPLDGRRNGLILRGDKIPGRLRAPRGLQYFIAEAPGGEWALRGVDDVGLVGRNVLHEMLAH